MSKETPDYDHEAVMRISFSCTAAPEDCLQAEHTAGKEQVAFRVVQDDPGEEVYLSREDTIRLRDFLTVALGESAPKAPPALPIDLREWDVYLDTLRPSAGDELFFVSSTSGTWQDEPLFVFAKRRKVRGINDRSGEQK